MVHVVEAEDGIDGGGARESHAPSQPDLKAKAEEWVDGDGRLSGAGAFSYDGNCKSTAYLWSSMHVRACMHVCDTHDAHVVSRTRRIAQATDNRL